MISKQEKKTQGCLLCLEIYSRIKQLSKTIGKMNICGIVWLFLLFSISCSNCQLIHSVLNHGEVSSPSTNWATSIIKCFYVVMGEFEHYHGRLA